MLFGLALATGTAFATTLVPEVMLDPREVREVGDLARQVDPECRPDNARGFGAGTSAYTVTVECVGTTDLQGRSIVHEIHCTRNEPGWSCELNAIRVRYGRGADSVDMRLDPGIGVDEGARVFDACWEQELLRAHYVQRQGAGYVIYAWANGMITDADVVLGDKPSCVRR